MRIDQETIAALDGAVVAGSHVKLLAQMDRQLYMKVNKVLEAAGGKWSRKDRAHIFSDDPADVLEQAILTGEITSAKQELGVFYTPAALADKAAALLGIQPGDQILEPSAGMGALALAAKRAGALAQDVYCLDLLPRHVDHLRSIGFPAEVTDFMDWFAPKPIYERVLMNPPFAKQADIAHITRALEWLKPGGSLVAIMSPGITFRTDRKTVDFLSLIGRCKSFRTEALPDGSFKESGTGVRTVLLKVVK